MTLHRPVVKPESETHRRIFQMFFAGVMIDAVQSAFQDGPYAFDIICAHAIADIFASRMIYRLVLV